MPSTTSSGRSRHPECRSGRKPGRTRGTAPCTDGNPTVQSREGVTRAVCDPAVTFTRPLGSIRPDGPVDRLCHGRERTRPTLPARAPRSPRTIRVPGRGWFGDYEVREPAGSAGFVLGRDTGDQQVRLVG